MPGIQRPNIKKGNKIIISVNFIARDFSLDNFTEDAVGHRFLNKNRTYALSFLSKQALAKIIYFRSEDCLSASEFRNEKINNLSQCGLEMLIKRVSPNIVLFFKIVRHKKMCHPVSCRKFILSSHPSPSYP